MWSGGHEGQCMLDITSLQLSVTTAAGLSILYTAGDRCHYVRLLWSSPIILERLLH